MEVPEQIVKKAPSAGLWKGQTDEGEIGATYEELDSILYLKLEKGMSEDEIIAWGIERSKVQKVLKMMRNSQHKRNPLPIPKTRTK